MDNHINRRPTHHYGQPLADGVVTPLGERLEHIGLVEPLDAGLVIGVGLHGRVDQRRVRLVGGLRQQHRLRVLVDRVLPPVDRLALVDVHAGGEALVDERSDQVTSDLARRRDMRR